MRKFIFVTLFAIAAILGNSFAAPVQLNGADRALEIRGAASGNTLGRPIVCVDLNNDGLEDIVVGMDISDYYGTEAHPLYIFMGKRSFSGNDLIDLAIDDADVVIYGETGSMDFANSLATGDVNHDGIPDLVMADSTFSPSGRTGAGVVYVIFGRADFFDKPVYNLSSGDWDVKIIGARAGDDAGGGGMAPFAGFTSNALAVADVNNDGIHDMIIGAHFADAGSKTYAGAVYIIWGRTTFYHGQTVDLLTQADVLIQGNEKDAELGTEIAVGDVNGDGIPDIILGEPFSSEGLWTYEGKVFAFWGRTSWTTPLTLSNANLVIKGAQKGDRLGEAVAVSDMNGDGIGDILALAYGWDNARLDNVDEGAIYGFYGKTNFPASIDLASQSPDLFVRGYNTANSLHWNLCAADFNGDGYGDVMFSSRDGERPGYNSEGRTYILFGKPSLPSTISVEHEEFDYIINGGMDYFQLGDTIAAGDVDGDGADEILIAAPFVDSGKGRLLVFDLNPRTASSASWNLYE